MNKIKRLSVNNVRIHSFYDLELTPHVTVIEGDNGSGKTSLIEAIYIALRGTSFRGSDSDIIKNGAPWYRVDVLFSNGSNRCVKYDPSKNTGKKQFQINDKTSYRMPNKDKYPIVLFEPDDIRLVDGSPTRRRHFLDAFIEQIDPHYARVIRSYEKALKQRNAVLKDNGTDESLFAWNVSLSQYGSYIIEKRLSLCRDLNNKINVTYNKIAHTDDSIEISYPNYSDKDISYALLCELNNSVYRDRALGYTTVGPHRHDLFFTFNGATAHSVVSRGEARTIVLALKFLEIEMLESIADKKPLVLLDDMFSELDEKRQRYLIETTKNNQTIITSAVNNSGFINGCIRL